jgi:hypothetical protein
VSIKSGQVHAAASVPCEDIGFELSIWDLSRLIEMVHRVSGTPCGRVNTVGRGGAAPSLVFALWALLIRGGIGRWYVKVATMTDRERLKFKDKRI